MTMRKSGFSSTGESSLSLPSGSTVSGSGTGGSPDRYHRMLISSGKTTRQASNTRISRTTFGQNSSIRIPGQIYSKPPEQGMAKRSLPVDDSCDSKMRTNLFYLTLSWFCLQLIKIVNDDVCAFRSHLNALCLFEYNHLCSTKSVCFSVPFVWKNIMSEEDEV